MSIVTKTGDKGETGLFGSQRVPKDSARIEAIGAVDELNALIGCILAEEMPETIRTGLVRIQHTLFTCGADLATPEGTNDRAKRVQEAHVQELEVWMHRLETIVPPLTAFILPGGSKNGSLLHYARAVCRRAERRVVTLSHQETLNPQLQIYLNRLSDLLFLLAREVNLDKKHPEITVFYE